MPKQTLEGLLTILRWIVDNPAEQTPAAPPAQRPPFACEAISRNSSHIYSLQRRHFS